MAESAPQLLENDIEAAPQQSVQDENAPTDGGKRSTRDKYEGQNYEQRLYESVYIMRDAKFARSFMNFHDLSLMNILHLMNELAKYDQAMRKDRAVPQDIEHIGDLLHRYSKCS